MKEKRLFHFDSAYLLGEQVFVSAAEETQGDFNKMFSCCAFHSWSCMSTVKKASALYSKFFAKRRLMIDYQSCVYAMKVHAKLELHSFMTVKTYW